MPSIYGPYDPDSAMVQIAQTSHNEVVVEEILSRKPRSLFDPIQMNSGLGVSSADARYEERSAKPSRQPSKFLTTSPFDGISASKSVVASGSLSKTKDGSSISNNSSNNSSNVAIVGGTPQRNSVKGPRPSPVMGPSYLSELKADPMFRSFDANDNNNGIVGNSTDQSSHLRTSRDNVTVISNRPNSYKITRKQAPK